MELIKNGWKKVKLSETILSSNTGLDAIKRAPIVKYDSGIKCLRIQDVSQDKKFEDWGFCNVEDKNFNKFQLKKGDIIVARTGATIGVNRIIYKDLDAVYNNGLIRIKINPNIINSDFLYYNLQTSDYRGHILAICAGTSTQPNMKMKDLTYFEFNLPPLEEQEKIASILKSLDDKIELNNKMNQTLEEMAQAIFKEWFVEFNFPNEDGVPYKDNEGEMEESELGEIPEGWKVEGVGKVFDVTMGQSPKGSSYNENREGTVFYQGRTDFSFRFPSNRIFTTEPKRMAKPLDVLLSVRAPVGDINVATEKCCIGRGLAAITSTKTSFLLYTMKNLAQKFKMFDNEGTVFGSINKKGLEELKVIVPSDKILNLFEEKINSFDSSILNNGKEIKALIKTRDTLLPKLMSGEVRV